MRLPQVSRAGSDHFSAVEGRATLIRNANVGRRELQGKVAIVTGAGQDFGKATARTLAYLGTSVVIAEINDAGLVVEQMIVSDGGQATFVKTDVSDPKSMEHLYYRVFEKFGRADILVNNITTLTPKPLLQYSLEEWDKIFAVNLRSAFLGTKLFLPAMLNQGSGVIVTMGAAEGMPFMAPYMATKAALRSLTVSLAKEIGKESGVSMYCFRPGMVDTPGFISSLKILATNVGINSEDFAEHTRTQLVSADVSATGLVGTILHASDFHGQETHFTEGLKKLGLTTRAYD